MSDTIGRVLRRVAAGTSSGSNLFQAKRALASSTGYAVVSDLNHMGDEAAARATWTHPGFAPFYAGAPSGTVAAPRLNDIDWTGVGYGTVGRTANACVGVTWVVPVGASDTLPSAVLRCRVACGTKFASVVGLYFGVAPGAGSFPSDTSNFASALITSSSLADQSLTIALAQSDLAPLVTVPTTGYTSSGVAPMAAAVRLMTCTLWFGAYNGNNNSSASQDAFIYGLSVGLEP